MTSFTSFATQYLNEHDATRLVQSLTVSEPKRQVSVRPLFGKSEQTSRFQTQLWCGSGNNGKTTLAMALKKFSDKVIIIEDELGQNILKSSAFQASIAENSIIIFIRNFVSTDDLDEFDQIFEFKNSFSNNEFLAPTITSF